MNILKTLTAVAALMVTSGTGQAWVKQQEYSPLQKCLMAPVNRPQDFAALNERCAVEEQVRQQEQQLNAYHYYPLPSH
jgi:hypothetical protein